MSSAQTTLGNANRLLFRLDTLLTGLNNDKALFGKLTKDERFARDLDSALQSIIKLSEQIRYQGLDANIRFFNSSTPVK